MSSDSVVCKACLCVHPEAVGTSSFDLSFKGHRRTFGIKGTILTLLLFPWRDQRITFLSRLCLGRVGTRH